MTDTTTPGPVPTAKTKPNKRRSRRTASKTSTRLRVYRTAMGLGPNIASTLLDLSETGLRVVLKEAPTVGQEVEVNLESPTGRTSKSAATVVWIIPATDGTFVVGLRLQKTLTYTDLQALSTL